LTLKIALVNSFYPPWRGGAETYTYNLAKALHRRGHEVTVVCANEPLPPGEYESNGLKVIRLRLWGRLYGTPIVPALFTKLCQLDVDLYHANFPSPYLAFNVAVVSQIKAKKAVLTWHNDLPPVTSAAGLLIEIHDRLVLPIYLRAYDRVIATSQTYVEISRILRKVGPRLRVIPNGVDCKQFNPNVKSPQLEVLRANKEFVLLFVGALTKWHKYKGLDVLLQALRIVAGSDPRVLLIIVGGGDLEPEYQQLTRQLGLTENVTFVGDVPDGLLPQYYSIADALVLPSKDMSEGFGLTLLEANAAGRPVIASRVGGIPSVVQDGCNGLLVRPNSSADLAKAILHFKEKPEEVKRMGVNGRLLAERHDWANVALQTEEVYQEALSAGI